MPHANAASGGVIVVTGGAGFIGSAVIRHLLDCTSMQVINVDKLTYAANLAAIPQARGNSRYRFEHVDICNGPELRRIFQAVHPDRILNLAAESHVDRSIDGPSEFVQTNLVGTFTLLQESLRYWRGIAGGARDNFRFLHVSTDEVFGTLSGQGLFSEESPYAPNSPYSATKAGSDHLVRAWRETYGLPAMITNCSNNFGPYQFPEKLIPHMIMRGLADQPLPVYGDGMNVRDWLYVEDHARALALVLEQGVVGETYNIGARCEQTNKAVVEAICDLLDEMSPSKSGSRRSLIEFAPDRPGHDRRYAIDPAKIENRLGWRPAQSFKSGLAETVRWYLENRPWWEEILQRGYEPTRAGLTSQKPATI
ncbi:MAG: dTDP-glucose 4,6-dehydratase [Pseudolabrys sp.]